MGYNWEKGYNAVEVVPVGRFARDTTGGVQRLQGVQWVHGRGRRGTKGASGTICT